MRKATKGSIACIMALGTCLLGAGSPAMCLADNVCIVAAGGEGAGTADSSGSMGAGTNAAVTSGAALASPAAVPNRMTKTIIVQTGATVSSVASLSMLAGAALLLTSRDRKEKDSAAQAQKAIAFESGA
jgi:hypothetical protein